MQAGMQLAPGWIDVAHHGIANSQFAAVIVANVQHLTLDKSDLVNNKFGVIVLYYTFVIWLAATLRIEDSFIQVDYDALILFVGVINMRFSVEQIHLLHI